MGNKATHKSQLAGNVSTSCSHCGSFFVDVAVPTSRCFATLYKYDRITSALDLMIVFATPASVSGYFSIMIPSLRDAGMKLGLICQCPNSSSMINDDVGEDMTAIAVGISSGKV